jgi:UPF0755 protein
MVRSKAKRLLRRNWRQGRKRYALMTLTVFFFLGIAHLLTSRPNPSLEGLPADPVTGMRLYEVPANATPATLAADLHEKGLIAFPRTFRLFLRLTRRDRQIKAGFYSIKPRNSVMEIAWLLTSGKLATRVVTFPEGKASWEIFSILNNRFILDSMVFDSLVHSSAFAHELGLNAPGLEGYLFPDTYVLPWKVNEREVLRLLVRRFQAVADQMHPLSPVTDHYGLHGWVTLASIVEKEAAVGSERKLIAGVFYNRLVQNWSLGADPTVRYAVRKLTGRITQEDLNIASPYNTRRFAGLPPGPICNPGKNSLLAALNPTDTDRMFFVAKDDGSRAHFFSRDNPEHLKFKAIAAENRKRRALAKIQADSEPEFPEPRDSAVTLKTR